ncbi:hypothetical protein ACJMK2_042856 [Sinanodonta woodiana]|uniref:Uncharacterized protein n=1 Tax=Sinanodonta woodiana TaxID=1069815 RepID=A0ABD3VV38_SINWO
MNPEVAASVGFRPKSKMLVNGAIPTLFDLSDPKDKHGKRSLTQTQTSKPSRKCSVIEKRRRLEVISEAMSQTMCSSIPHEAEPIEHESGNANTQDIDICLKMIQTTYNLVKRRHVGVQTTIELPPGPYVKTVTRAVQTDESNLENNLDSSFMSLCDDDLTEDPDWNPEDEEDEGPEKLDDQLEVNAAKERKFIVYESCLDKLFNKTNYQIT